MLSCWEPWSMMACGIGVQPALMEPSVLSTSMKKENVDACTSSTHVQRYLEHPWRQLLHYESPLMYWHSMTRSSPTQHGLCKYCAVFENLSMATSIPSYLFKMDRGSTRSMLIMFQRCWGILFGCSKCCFHLARICLASRSPSIRHHILSFQTYFLT